MLANQSPAILLHWGVVVVCRVMRPHALVLSLRFQWLAIARLINGPDVLQGCDGQASEEALLLLHSCSDDAVVPLINLNAYYHCRSCARSIMHIAAGSARISCAVAVSVLRKRQKQAAWLSEAWANPAVRYRVRSSETTATSCSIGRGVYWL
ncbi:hypothetical protein F5Y07DRAFT_186155 [Xylaria sp. FL0933]|nr:hypothetical protein F5Y07DRAFT_186155 [Xylaria sp. FL0933]